MLVYGAEVKPVLLLFLLVAGGVLAALWLSSRPLAPQPGTDDKSDQPEASGWIISTPDAGGRPGDESEQIRQLEGMVEYLEGQVKVLREENDALLEQLGRLGMKANTTPNPTVKSSAASEEPDFVGLGLDLMKLRELNMLPVPTRLAPAAAVEKCILAWLRAQQPGDHGLRRARTLHALGWIPEAIDPLPLRARLLRLQLGGWYDAEEDTLLLDEEGSVSADAFRDALGMAYAQALREFGNVLFPSTGKPLTLDAMLAREALLAGDAGLTRLLYSLQNPAWQSRDSLPPEDPDHPYNQVPLPFYLRQLHFFPFNEGLEFMQGLHGVGGFGQMSASYSRPPTGSLEILDTERYLKSASAVAVEVTLPEPLRALNPFWEDTLGQFAILTALRAWNDDERAGLGARGWAGDRLLAFAEAGEAERGSVVWQTLWQDEDWAEAFFRAMLNNLRQQYQLPAAEAGDGLFCFQAAGRQVTMQRNRGGQGVLLIDATTGPTASAIEHATR